MLRLARFCGIPAIYTHWARATLRLYQSVTWSRGRLGRLLDSLLPRPEA
jgi:hypothetical protein